MKEPFASDRVVLCIVPFALRTCTVAPAITAPEVSTTVPDICADNDESGKIDKNMTAAYRELLFPGVHFIFIPLTSFLKTVSDPLGVTYL